MRHLCLLLLLAVGLASTSMEDVRECFMCHLIVETRLQSSRLAPSATLGVDHFCKFIPKHVGTPEWCEQFLQDNVFELATVDRHTLCNKYTHCPALAQPFAKELFDTQVEHVSNALAMYAYVQIDSTWDVTSNDRAEILYEKYMRLPQSVYTGARDDLLRHTDEASYIVGTGVYDITGPVADAVFFGYADTAQKGRGLHHRLRARAYHIGDAEAGNFFVIVHTDLWAAGQHLKRGVVSLLRTLYPRDYDFANIMITCTHTHAGPGGYDEFIAYNLVSLGLNTENYDNIVAGIVEAIVRARNNAQAGSIFVNYGDVENVNVQRSLDAYNNNPAEERNRYGIDRDEGMTLLKFVGVNGTDLGSINWHAAHAVSMKNTNRLVSSDNKGIAAYLFEQAMGAADYSNSAAFAASFAQSNAGDISPNTGGCGRCGPMDELVGEGEDDLESTVISATRMFDAAKLLYDSATEEVVGGVSARTTNVDFRDLYVSSVNATTTHGAFGYSMLAGTPDGWVLGNFANGLTEVIPILEFVSKIFYDYDDIYKESQAPKPIILPTGLATFFGINIPLTPQILQIQILRVGQVAVLAFPSEISTMAGRRLREAMQAILADAGVKYYPVSGLTNGYSQYVVTQEEYDMQWFEGASTHFNRHTLAGYIQEFSRLAVAIRDDTDVDSGPDLMRMFNVDLLPDLQVDQVPAGANFGDVIVNVDPTYSRGDIVAAEFYGAHPSHKLRTQGTFLTVEIRNADSSWTVVARDSELSTKFHWHYQDDDRATAISIVGIEWQIPEDAVAGIYRLVYTGDRKLEDSSFVEVVGTSSEFSII